MVMVTVMIMIVFIRVNEIVDNSYRSSSLSLIGYHRRRLLQDNVRFDDPFNVRRELCPVEPTHKVILFVARINPCFSSFIYSVCK